MMGPEIERLVGLMARLPGLGPRSARRIVLKLMSEREQRLLPLIAALDAACQRVAICPTCGGLDSQQPCVICADIAREPLICVVESVADQWALERAAVYRGRYHVLGGLLSAIAGRGPEELGIDRLLARLDGSVREVILALPATVDGQATAHYLTERLATCGAIVTRLAQGVPVGGSIEILDEGTLALALSARRAAG
ncbi:MAG TPA: recombination mediator RecR [Acidiphilium sp.]|uniref:recombination mediator RecR n=1 Tax=unclassified Acidiphilium TaxID=2617493 RepID=UPI000BCB5E26|nr:MULTISPECIES: recombination mediator RecR [unclassified Acidiphilium]OYV55381.1 MAG: recombination protein RecR [Acidiphilium sp. 20-67-58]HQT61883.1 recombination mediator RecR [Acidiphilium sp.]HQU11982.1 recombination mediator RecR [Acidiphilium sp.]